MTDGIVGNPAIFPRVIDIGFAGDSELGHEVLDHPEEVRAVVVAMLRQIVEAIHALRCPRSPRDCYDLPARGLQLDAEAVRRGLTQLGFVRRSERPFLLCATATRLRRDQRDGQAEWREGARASHGLPLGVDASL